MRGLKKTRGITLIALIITIIVLLILAGITISIFIGDNTLFTTARNATEEYKEAEAREKLQTILYELTIDKQVEEKYNKEEYLTAKLEEKKFIVNGDIVIVDEYQYQIDREKLIIIDELGLESNGATIIRTKEDMIEFRNKVNQGETYEGQTVTLEANIDLSEIQWEPIGTLENTFKGTFNGKDNTINNVSINSIEEKNNIGLFGYVDGGIIKNLQVNGTVIANGSSVAGIVGRLLNGEVNNCINHMNVTNTSTTFVNTGGIVGSGTNIQIINCKNTGNIKSLLDNVGGIIGNVDTNDIDKNIIIANCINVSQKIESGRWNVGGIIGNTATGMEIKDCKNTSEIYGGNGNCGGIIGCIGNDDPIIFTVTATGCINTGYIHAEGKTGNPSLGGIIGSIHAGDLARVENSYNKGEIASTSYTSGNIYFGVGGIVGTIYNNASNTANKSKAIVMNSYNVGNISNTYNTNNAGQIIGMDYNSNGVVTNCFYITRASGGYTYGGTALFFENMVTETFVNLLNQAEMYSTTMNWTSSYIDNDNYVWSFGSEYPCLKWEGINESPKALTYYIKNRSGLLFSNNRRMGSIWKKW